MNYKLALSLTLAAALPLLSISANAAGGKAHAHLGHVMTSWGDTPDNMGFLPTAMAEATITLKHANLAAKDPGNLDAMKLHAGHVLNTLDPSLQKKGPGLGYGVIAAAKATTAHINFAAKSSNGVKSHAKHVSQTADNTTMRAQKLVSLAQKIMTAKTANEAAAMMKELVSVSAALSAGVDLDGDGKVSWKGGEGGLMTANAHMGFMMKGENL
jgi:hypothetical protein